MSKRASMLILALTVLFAATAPGWAQDTTPPSVPGGVSTSKVCPTRVQVQWTASTDDVGVAGYKIYQNGNQVGVATGTTFTDVYGNVLPSTTYSYTVSAYDAAGNDSGQSSASAVTTDAYVDKVKFSISNCSTRVSTTKPYTKVWSQSFKVCDAKYHWNTRAANNAGAGNGQIYYVEGMGYGTGGGGYGVAFPAQSSPTCVTASSTANHYLPTPGSYTQLKAYFPFPDVFSVEYIELDWDSWYDRFAPKVMNVTSDLADGTYGADQVVDVKITFSEVVNVTGARGFCWKPETQTATRHTAPAAAAARLCSCTQCKRTTALVTWTTSQQFSLQLNGGTIKDGYGNNATLTLPSPNAPMSLGNNKNIVIDTTPPPATIGEVKKLADGVSVGLTEKTVTAVFTDHFYMQDDSSSGIRVAPATMPTGLAVGDTVDVVGTLATTSDSERVIVPTSVDVSTGSTITPVSLTNKDLGGGDFFYNPGTGAGQIGVEDGIGVNNIGLLVKTCGTVTAVGATYFYIDDGTHARDFSIFNGIRVRCGALTKPSSGDYICVSGISSIMKVNGRVFRSITPRDGDDIQLMSP